MARVYVLQVSHNTVDTTNIGISTGSYVDCPGNKESMQLAYPHVSKALAFIVTLFASSAEVFSTMKRIKSPITADTLDSLIRISIEVHDWDPSAAHKLWEGMGNTTKQ